MSRFPSCGATVWIEGRAHRGSLPKGSARRRVLFAQLFGRSEAKDLLGAAFWTKVDQVIRRLDQLEVVLDDEDGMALVDEPLRRADESAHVLHVEAVVGSSSTNSV